MSYKRFKYFHISKMKKIRFLSIKSSSKLCVIFLHGFMSDIEGEKPLNFAKFCHRKKINFLALEYSGHGKSYGKFTDGNISSWTNDAYKVIKSRFKNLNFIIIGSSMGSWIALNLIKKFQKKVKGFIGIGSAPEFLERLMWKKFTKKMKKETIKNGIYNLKHGDYEYPISYQLIKDGRKNKVLNKNISQDINITMVHGSKDKSVPVTYSRKMLKIFKSKKKKLVIIKNGDHSLSSPKYLKILKKELKLIIN